jgi:hypothetical protein
MNALVPIPTSNAEVYRASTDAAGLCKEIVLKTAQNIQGRKYIKVEGWQAIAVAHGCAASADHVERVEDDGMSGFRAVGIVRRMSDGAEIARAEGFLGDDETMWSKRPVYARRAMVQTRAISRACRSAFAHVVVLIDANLSTTPAEEVPDGGFDEAPERQPASDQRPTASKGERLSAKTLGDEMERCRSVSELLEWEQGRLSDINALPRADHTALGKRFTELSNSLPQETPTARQETFELDDEIPF